MSENIGNMSLREWKQLQEYKEQYRKICAAEDRAIRDWANGIEPVKKIRKKKTNG